MEWQPIETAPKDGTAIIGAWDSKIFENRWFIHPVIFENGIWIHYWDQDEDHVLYPTHWMPLPEPPTN